MSWHHGDWLAFAQAVVAALAIVGAFAVVFVQHSMHVRHADRSAERDRLRERYRASTYAEALLQNAIDCAVPILNSIESMSKRRDLNGDATFDASRLDKASDALGQAIHSGLPTEITTCVLSAWMAIQQFCHALRRTEVVSTMKMAELHAYCGEQYSVLNASMEIVRMKKAKWEGRLNEK
ncbi:hypothetical protein F3J14_01040 [Burkholderia sp. Tr-862]|uniref:hypothetical protein n=1 Tax=Burkholderia sp. Tr-862 TaxID=2608331 RepID=UPI0014193955|nr:hypothetical protein [Burkholderia sp. Tr-862]NIF39511.1 hypothetical protein [Burkholderia sp. Tr-862]